VTPRGHDGCVNQLLALVLTDMVDSTQLNERLGDTRMVALWASHDRAARELMEKWGATEVARSDGFLLLFSGVHEAVGFSLAYHRMLALLKPPMAARVGVHVGPVRLRHNSADDHARGAPLVEVDGIALPTAARVMGAATGRQTLLTSQAAQALGSTSLRCVSHGHWRLKGLTEPVELFGVSEPPETSDTPESALTPPAESPKAYRVVWRNGVWLPVTEVPQNLPAERDSFVGRAEVLGQLADRFEGGARMVTVLGIGGMGKTRLSQHYARTCLGSYPGGVWFCDLSWARSVDGVVHAVAQGLSVPLGRADPVQQLGAAIAGRGRCLVVLDNLEQVARYAEATLGAWLERAPEACFLVTSREVLGIVGEQMLPLQPLSSEEAVTLFQQRVDAVGSSREYNTDDKAALVPLMDLLDRLPLAIELAAARGRVMSPHALLQRMSDRFKMLVTRQGRRDRQATLQATLDWSWALLTSSEQALLSQLSVFEGGFTLPAVEAIVDLSPWDDVSAADVVQALVEKSLIYQSGAGRFDLLNSVRDYAAEQLRRLAASQTQTHRAQEFLQTRHQDFFASLTERSQSVELVLELDNLIAAIRRAAAAGRVAPAVTVLHGAWAALRLQGPFRRVLELTQMVRAMDFSGQEVDARVDWFAGWALKACGQMPEAEACFETALSGARRAGDARCEAYVLTHLGGVQVGAGQFERGVASLEAALALARLAHDSELECEAQTELGNAFWGQGRLEEARIHYEAVLATARRSKIRRWEGGSLGNLGVMSANQGDNLTAERFYLEALDVARELGDRQWTGNTLANLALLHHMQGRLDEAANELEAALTTARELGHVRLEAVVLINLGIVLEAKGERDRAREHYDEALRVAIGLGDRRSQGQVLGYLGALHAREGHFEAGRACLASAEEHLTQLSDRLSLAVLHCSRAECEWLAGAADAAQQALAQAEQLAQELGADAGSEVAAALSHVRGIMFVRATAE